MKTLDLLKTGMSCMIEKMAGGEHFLSRVTAMGFTPDTRVVMVENRRLGPLIVYLRDTEVALGREEAARIGIREVRE